MEIKKPLNQIKSLSKGKILLLIMIIILVIIITGAYFVFHEMKLLKKGVTTFPPDTTQCPIGCSGGNITANRGLVADAGQQMGWHKGVDLNCSNTINASDPIYAVSDGCVQAADYNFLDCGNVLVIRGTDNVWYQYCHLNSFAAGITDGAHVIKGQLVGYTGTTGGVGEHLHFGMFNDKNANLMYDSVDYFGCVPDGINYSGNSVSFGGNYPLYQTAATDPACELPSQVSCPEEENNTYPENYFAACYYDAQSGTKKVYNYWDKSGPFPLEIKGQSGTLLDWNWSNGPIRDYRNNGWDTGKSDYVFAVWRGRINVYQSGDYTFTIDSDNGFLLEIDGGQYINTNDILTNYEKTIHLTRDVTNGGWHNFKIRWFDDVDVAKVKVDWRESTQLPGIILWTDPLPPFNSPKPFTIKTQTIDQDYNLDFMRYYNGSAWSGFIDCSGGNPQSTCAKTPLICVGSGVISGNSCLYTGPTITPANNTTYKLAAAAWDLNGNHVVTNQYYNIPVGDGSKVVVAQNGNSPPSYMHQPTTSSGSVKVNLKWTDTSGESGYYLQKSVAGGSFSDFKDLPGGTISYSDTLLSSQEGKNLTYRVRARFPDNSYSLSNDQSISAPSTPTDPTARCGNGIKEVGEECDPPGSKSSYACNFGFYRTCHADCTWRLCTDCDSTCPYEGERWCYDSSLQVCGYWTPTPGGLGTADCLSYRSFSCTYGCQNNTCNSPPPGEIDYSISPSSPTPADNIVFRASVNDPGGNPIFTGLNLKVDVYGHSCSQFPFPPDICGCGLINTVTRSCTFGAASRGECTFEIGSLPAIPGGSCTMSSMKHLFEITASNGLKKTGGFNLKCPTEYCFARDLQCPAKVYPGERIMFFPKYIFPTGLSDKYFKVTLGRNGQQIDCQGAIYSKGPLCEMNDNSEQVSFATFAPNNPGTYTFTAGCDTGPSSASCGLTVGQITTSCKTEVILPPLPPCVSFGDVDNDGYVDGRGAQNDLDMVKFHILNPEQNPLTPEQKLRADVDGNGKIDSNDYSLISRYLDLYIRGVEQQAFPICQDTDNNGLPNYLEDSDHDGFSYETEMYIGTDPFDACSDNISDPAWPFDINNDTKVNVGDILKFSAESVLLTKEGDPKFNRRYDLNADRKVNVGDILLYSAKNVLLTKCSNP